MKMKTIGRKWAAAAMALAAGVITARAVEPVLDNLPGAPGQSGSYWEAVRAEAAAKKAAAAAKAASTATAPAQAAQAAGDFFTGKPFDADLGGYVFKYRTYDPHLGRWTTPDPSGFPDGANGYAYGSDGFSEVDPNGCFTVDVTDKIAPILNPIATSTVGKISGLVNDAATGMLSHFSRVAWKITSFSVSASVTGTAHGHLVLIPGRLVNGDATVNYQIPSGLKPSPMSGTVGSGGTYQGYVTNNGELKSNGTFDFKFNPPIRIEDAVWGTFDVDVTTANGDYNLTTKWTAEFRMYE